MRLRVLLFLCVGILMCWVKLNVLRRFRKLRVVVLLLLLIVKLKFLMISNFFGEEIIDFRNEENFVKNRDEVRLLMEDGGG